MTKITLDQFCDQWAPGGSFRSTLSHFEMQIFDFVTIAGDIAREHFKSSFREKGFAGMGQKWPSRKSKWARRPGNRHPMMIDEGTLLNSIKSSKDRMKYGEIHGKKLSGLSKNFRISTAEYTRANPKKRGLNPKSDGTYAAIHNDPQPGVTKNQYTLEAPEQRQFIGHNKALEAKIAAIIPDIFENLPPKI